MIKFIMFRKPQQWILALLFLLTILASKSLSAPPDQPINSWTLRNMMGRGVNMKTALGGKHNWWIKYNPKHGEAIQKAGFNSVRVWFFWAGLNSGSPDYTLSPDALADMEYIINDLLNRNLVVVLVPMELGNYGEKNLTTNPSAHKAKYLSIWKQLADRFRNHSHRLVFDLFNEPHGELGKKELNDWYESVVPIIRKTNPTRVLIFNGDDWGTASTLKNIIIPPEAGQYVMGDFHYYWPKGFTHHGKEAWTGTVEQKNRVRVEFNKAVAWSKKYDIPVVSTEWGSNNIRTLSEREAYHLFIRDELLVRGFPYQQYAFSDAKFKMYDGFKYQWVYPTLRDIAVAGDASWEVSASKPDHRPKWKQYLANLRFDFLFKYLFF